MHVTVKYSGLFYALAGVEKETVDIIDGGTINHMIDILRRKHKKLPIQDEKTFFIVNDKISKREQVLTEGDQVIVLRMLAGG
jgi:molybdopterin converting factor small subunit